MLQIEEVTRRGIIGDLINALKKEGVDISKPHAEKVIEDQFGSCFGQRPKVTQTLSYDQEWRIFTEVFKPSNHYAARLYGTMAQINDAIDSEEGSGSEHPDHPREFKLNGDVKYTTFRRHIFGIGVRLISELFPFYKFELVHNSTVSDIHVYKITRLRDGKSVEEFTIKTGMDGSLEGIGCSEPYKYGEFLKRKARVRSRLVPELDTESSKVELAYGSPIALDIRSRQEGAGKLRKSLSELDVSLSSSQAHRVFARQFGYNSPQALKSAIVSPPLGSYQGFVSSDGLTYEQEMDIFIEMFKPSQVYGARLLDTIDRINDLIDFGFERGNEPVGGRRSRQANGERKRGYMNHIYAGGVAIISVLFPFYKFELVNKGGTDYHSYKITRMHDGKSLHWFTMKTSARSPRNFAQEFVEDPISEYPRLRKKKDRLLKHMGSSGLA